MVVMGKNAWIPRCGADVRWVQETATQLLDRYAPYACRVPLPESADVRSLAERVVRSDHLSADRVLRGELSRGATPGAMLLALVQRCAHRLDLELIGDERSRAAHAVGMTGLRRLAARISRRVQSPHPPREERVGIFSFRGGRPTLFPLLHAIYADFSGWNVELREGVNGTEAAAAVESDWPDVLLCVVTRSADVKSARAMQRVCGARCFVVGSPLDAPFLRRAALQPSRILFDPRETLELLERFSQRSAPGAH